MLIVFRATLWMLRPTQTMSGLMESSTTQYWQKATVSYLQTYIIMIHDIVYSLEPGDIDNHDGDDDDNDVKFIAEFIGYWLLLNDVVPLYAIGKS